LLFPTAHLGKGFFKAINAIASRGTAISMRPTRRQHYISFATLGLAPSGRDSRFENRWRCASIASPGHEAHIASLISFWHSRKRRSQE
jgi:hypothetical protein